MREEIKNECGEDEQIETGIQREVRPRKENV